MQRESITLPLFINYPTPLIYLVYRHKSQIKIGKIKPQQLNLRYIIFMRRIFYYLYYRRIGHSHALSWQAAKLWVALSKSLRYR